MHPRCPAFSAFGSFPVPHVRSRQSHCCCDSPSSLLTLRSLTRRRRIRSCGSSLSSTFERSSDHAIRFRFRLNFGEGACAAERQHRRRLGDWLRDETSNRVSRNGRIGHLNPSLLGDHARPSVPLHSGARVGTRRARAVSASPLDARLAAEFSRSAHRADQPQRRLTPTTLDRSQRSSPWSGNKVERRGDTRAPTVTGDTLASPRSAPLPHDGRRLK